MSDTDKLYDLLEKEAADLIVNSIITFIGEHIERLTAQNLLTKALEYADEVLSQSENRLREMIESFRNECVSVDEYFNNSLNTLYENRQELRGINGR